LTMNKDSSIEISEVKEKSYSITTTLNKPTEN